MYGCESWTIKKAEPQRIDAFELWCWRRLLRVPWTARSISECQAGQCPRVSSGITALLPVLLRGPLWAATLIPCPANCWGPAREESGVLGFPSRRGLTPRGSLECNPDAQGVSGPSSSCVWNPRVFADDARGWQCPFVLCLHPQGCLRRGVRHYDIWHN